MEKKQREEKKNKKQRKTKTVEKIGGVQLTCAGKENEWKEYDIFSLMPCLLWRKNPRKK